MTGTAHVPLGSGLCIQFLEIDGAGVGACLIGDVPGVQHTELKPWPLILLTSVSMDARDTDSLFRR